MYLYRCFPPHPRWQMNLKCLSFAGLCSMTLMAAFCASAGGQTTSGPNPQPVYDAAGASLPDAPQPQATESARTEDSDAVTLRNTPAHLLKDQGAIWTSPLRLRPHDLEWLVPLTLATGAAIATDHRALSSVVSHDATFNNDNVDASNVLTGGLIAAPVLFIWSRHFHA